MALHNVPEQQQDKNNKNNTNALRTRRAVVVKTGVERTDRGHSKATPQTTTKIKNNHMATVALRTRRAVVVVETRDERADAEGAAFNNKQQNSKDKHKRKKQHTQYVLGVPSSSKPVMSELMPKGRRPPCKVNFCCTFAT
jgi:hypothetical protein